MSKIVRQWIYKIWYEDSKWAIFLLPLAWLMRIIIELRLFLYRTGMIEPYRLPVPVIIIGNITVGGSGKTPLVIALCNMLKQQGLSVGVVASAYEKEMGEDSVEVTADSDPEIFGDEPVMIAQNTQCPVFIGKYKSMSAHKLYQTAKPQIILCDDGLQHYRLARDMEVVVVNGEKLFGNRHTIPAGPLREPVARLKKADFVVYQEKEGKHENNFYQKPKALISISPEKQSVELSQFVGKKVHGVAGIAHPDLFFQQLRDLGMEVIPHPFADHHQYVDKDLTFNDEYPIIMTEKDAVKCYPSTLKNGWYLAVDLVICSHFLEQFTKRIQEMING